MNHAWTGKLVPNKSKRGPSWNERCRLTTDKETKRDGEERRCIGCKGGGEEEEERKGEGSVAPSFPYPTRVNAGKNGDSANVFRGCARSLFSDN